MSLTHLHLMLNHLPLVGIPLGLLALWWGISRNDIGVLRFAAVVFILIGIVAPIVYLTGDSAEELVEDLPLVSESRIETHEAWGAATLIVSELLAVLSAAYLWFGFALQCSRRTMAIGVLVTIPLLTTLFWTGKSGGEIRHSELRGGAADQASARHEESDDDD